MTNQTISELLLLLFLAISCSRIFFIKNVRSDPLALLPLIHEAKEKWTWHSLRSRI